LRQLGSQGRTEKPKALFVAKGGSRLEGRLNWEEWKGGTQTIRRDGARGTGDL